MALGLDVNAASFAEGEAFIAVIKAGLNAVVSTAGEVADAFVGIAGESKQVGVLGDLFGGAGQKTLKDYAAGVDSAMTVTKEAIDGTVKRMTDALDKAKTVHDYVFGYIRLLWAKLLQFVAPVVTEIAAFVIKNGLFIRDIFVGAFDFIKKNWNTVKVALAVGVAAVTAAFVVLKWEAIKSAAAAAAAWLAAAWPFILLGGLIAGLLLALDDIRVYLQGGDSLFGRWKKAIEAWLSVKADDPPWLKSIKSFLARIKEALTQQGAIEGFFGRIKGFFSDVWERIKAIDWSPFYRVFLWLAEKAQEIDWKTWGYKLLAVLGFIGDKVRSIDWNRWWLAIEGIGLRIWSVYLTIKGMVQAVGSFIEKLNEANAAVRRFPSKVGSFVSGIFGGGKGEEGGAEERAATPAAGATARGPVDMGGFTLPDFTGYQPEVPTYAPPPRAPQITQHITRGDTTIQITQREGESMEDLARRVVDEQMSRQNEDLAASFPPGE